MQLQTYFQVGAQSMCTLLCAPTPPSAPPLPPRHPAKRRRVCCSVAQQHVTVIGGGAAGLSAAFFAADAGAEVGSGVTAVAPTAASRRLPSWVGLPLLRLPLLQVTVLEKNSEAGKKILISGGTRCNVLPAAVDVDADYFTESSRSALRSVFSRWSLAECQLWLEDPGQVGIPLAIEEETRKLFPASNSAADVRDCLVAACRRRGVHFVHGAALTSLQHDGGAGWRCGVSTDGRQQQHIAQRVVLATGGKSFASLGTDGVGYGICAAHGHSLHPPYPALTPLLGSHPGGGQLAGISMYDTQLSVASAPAGGGGAQRAKRGTAGRTSERTALLLTHRGWSGPAVLDLSHHLVMARERGQPAPALRQTRSALRRPQQAPLVQVRPIRLPTSRPSM